MFLGKVIGDVESDDTNSRACDKSRLKMVQKLDLYRNASGPSTIAVDFLGASDGDIVMVGTPSNDSGPSLSLAQDTSSGIMIMGILNREQTQASNVEAIR